MYVLIHLGNINNSEREYKGRNVWEYQNGRPNIKTPNSGKRTRGSVDLGGRRIIKKKNRVTGTEGGT